jgi:hypothetical protein
VAISFFSGRAERTEKNPNGYLNPHVDITTASGQLFFRKNLMKYADACIEEMKRMDAQGILIWDLEGFLQPELAYVGHPEVLPEYSPCMNAVADEFFKKFTDAGFKVGVTIRPTILTHLPNGKWTARRVRESEAVDSLSKSIEYANQRWGCTLFYMDSNSYLQSGSKNTKLITVEMIAELNRCTPGILIFPEHHHPELRYHEVCAPYRAAFWLGWTGTPPNVRKKYPNAFSIVSFGGNLDHVYQHWNAYVANMAAGDIFLVNIPRHSRNDMIIELMRNQIDWQKNANGTELKKWRENLHSTEPSTRFNATRIVAREKISNAVPILIKLLRTEKNINVRKAAFESLTVLCKDSAVPLLFDELRESNPICCGLALAQLMAIKEKKLIVPGALALAKENNPKFRRYGTILLDGLKKQKLRDYVGINGGKPVVGSASTAWPIEHGKGIFDFQWTAPAGTFLWFFNDGTISAAHRPTRRVTKGVSYLIQYRNDWSGNYWLKDHKTNSNYTGNLSDFPSITYFASFADCINLTGDIASLSHLTHSANFINCFKLRGDIANLSKLTDSANFANCSKLKGDIANLSNLKYSANFSGCIGLVGNIANLSNLKNSANFNNCSNLKGDIASLSNLTYSANFNNCSNLKGDIASLSNLTSSANFNNCSNLKGDIASLSNLTSSAEFNNCINLKGDIASLSNLTSSAEFNNCINLKGDIANLKVSRRAYFNGASGIHGVIKRGVKVYEIQLQKTGMSKAEIEQSLINIRDTQKLTKRKNGFFRCDTEMPGIDNPKALQAKADLEAKGWTVAVNVKKP